MTCVEDINQLKKYCDEPVITMIKDSQNNILYESPISDIRYRLSKFLKATHLEHMIVYARNNLKFCDSSMDRGFVLNMASHLNQE